MALNYDTNDRMNLYRMSVGEIPSIVKIEKAEQRLKEKKKIVEDMQNELRLLEFDAFDTLKKEVYYFDFPYTSIEKAVKWIKMSNDKENKIDKRKKYEEKDAYEYLTYTLEKYLDKKDIKITEIIYEGYSSYAVNIFFTCQGYDLYLKVPMIQNISMKEYQYYGQYIFKLTLYHEVKKSISEAIDSTFREPELKDILNKFLEEHNAETEKTSDQTRKK